MAEQYDVVIVGSGPLGTSVARRLAEHERNVLILEQGTAITEPPGSHLRNNVHFRKNPDAYLEVAAGHLTHFDSTAPRDNLPGASVTKTRGGQGVIWTNLCPRGDVLWDALTPAQWEEYYMIAENYLGVQAGEFETSKRQKRIRARLAGHLAARGRTISALPVAARFDAEGDLLFTAPYDILADSKAASGRVRISRADVSAVVGHGSRITGVVAGTETIEAREVVIAAGAIGTPELLHRSGIRPRSLGRWLSYHPILITQLVLDPGVCAEPGVTDRAPRLQIPPTNAAEWYALILRDVSPFKPAGPDVAVDPNRIVEMQLICPVDIDERNGIRFDEHSRPSFEVPLSTADESRLAAAEADADEITGLLGRYRAGCRPMWLEFGFAHMTGTTRMSATDDGTGVAGYNGRVWGFDNLRLATNGLIPTRMAVNPTLTGVALAAWIADSIVMG
jgi:choline dehydrogenase-like flavoprotein